MFACLISKLSRKVRKWVDLVTRLHANPPSIKSQLCKHSGPKHPSVQNILDSWQYLFQWYIVGNRRSPERNVWGVNEVLSECVLITRAEPCWGPHYIRVLQMAKSPPPQPCHPGQTQGTGKAFFWSKCQCLGVTDQCVQPPELPPPRWLQPETALLQRPPTDMNSLLFFVLYLISSWKLWLRCPPSQPAEPSAFLGVSMISSIYL